MHLVAYSRKIDLRCTKPQEQNNIQFYCD